MVVPPHGAKHGDPASHSYREESRRGGRAIGALAPGTAGEIRAQNGLTGGGDVRTAGHEVHIEGADDQDEHPWLPERHRIDRMIHRQPSSGWIVAEDTVPRSRPDSPRARGQRGAKVPSR